MASQSRTESKKLSFLSKVQSNSFPRGSREGSYYTALLSESDPSSPLVSYTSLRDLLPSKSKINPYSAGYTIESAYDIPITNLLVKKAASIYLQPRALPPSVAEEHIFCRAWVEVKSPVKACYRFIRTNVFSKIACAFEKFLGAILFCRSCSLG